MRRPRSRGKLVIAFAAVSIVACRSHHDDGVVQAREVRDASAISTPDVRLIDASIDAVRDAGIDPERLQAFCRARADANERVYRRATRHGECPGERALHAHAAMSRCAVAARGAWALALRELHAIDGDAAMSACEGGWDPVFSDGTGVEARVTEAETPFVWRQDATGGVIPGALLASDLDGDGIPEALVRSHITGPRTADSNWTIVTVHAGSVVPFSPVADLVVTDVADFDHDGRLDFVTAGPYVARGEENDEFTGFTGPPLLAHTLGDGTFAFDDALARAFARRQCPRHARDVVVRRAFPDGGAATDLPVGNDLDLEATGRRAVCARIAGATVREVLDELSTVCTGYASRDRDAGVPTAPGTCPGFLRAWASTTPPVTFAPMH